MRHQKAGKRLGRNTSHRKALLRNMATSLLEHGRIETTEIKAKELRRYAEKMITLGKRGDLHARRQALSFLRKRDVVAKVFDEYADRFKDRPGGYTRVMKLGTRTGDGARMAIIELLPTEKKKDKKKEKEKTKKETGGVKEKAEMGEKGEKKETKAKGKENTKKLAEKEEKKEPKAKEKESNKKVAEKGEKKETKAKGKENTKKVTKKGEE